MEYPVWYEKISEPFRSASAARALAMADGATVVVVAGAYIAVLGALFFLIPSSSFGNALFWRFLAVPAVTFILVSIARIAVNKSRPYELYQIQPVLKRDKGGKSMPSRHMASAAIIAIALLWLCFQIDWLGVRVACAMVFICVPVIAFARIVGGVHFPRDIVVAIAVACLCGFVGFVVV